VYAAVFAAVLVALCHEASATPIPAWAQIDLLDTGLIPGNHSSLEAALGPNCGDTLWQSQSVFETEESIGEAMDDAATVLVTTVPDATAEAPVSLSRAIGLATLAAPEAPSALTAAAGLLATGLILRSYHRRKRKQGRQVRR